MVALHLLKFISVSKLGENAVSEVGKAIEAERKAQKAAKSQARKKARNDDDAAINSLDPSKVQVSNPFAAGERQGRKRKKGGSDQVAPKDKRDRGREKGDRKGKGKKKGRKIQDRGFVDIDNLSKNARRASANKLGKLKDYGEAANEKAFNDKNDWSSYNRGKKGKGKKGKPSKKDVNSDDNDDRPAGRAHRDG